MKLVGQLGEVEVLRREMQFWGADCQKGRVWLCLQLRLPEGYILEELGVKFREGPLMWNIDFFFMTGSHVAQVSLKLSMYPRMSFPSSQLQLLRDEIPGVALHAWLL